MVHTDSKYKWATKENSYFPWNTGCLIGILYNGLSWSLYNWVGFHPLYTQRIPTQPGFFPPQFPELHQKKRHLLVTSSTAFPATCAAVGREKHQLGWRISDVFANPALYRLDYWLDCIRINKQIDKRIKCIHLIYVYQLVLVGVLPWTISRFAKAHLSIKDVQQIGNCLMALYPWFSWWFQKLNFLIALWNATWLKKGRCEPQYDQISETKNAANPIFSTKILVDYWPVP